MNESKTFFYNFLQHFGENLSILIPNLYPYDIKIQININQNSIKIRVKNHNFFKGFMGFLKKQYTIDNTIYYNNELGLGSK